MKLLPALLPDMVSLWGSKKDDDNAADESRSDVHGEAPRHVDADERTRLLPPPSRQDRFLSPDDPAVSNSLNRIASQRS